MKIGERTPKGRDFERAFSWFGCDFPVHVRFYRTHFLKNRYQTILPEIRGTPVFFNR